MSPYPKAREGLLRQELDGETVVYDRAQDRIHLLDPTTSSVLALLDGERSPAVIANELGHSAGSELVALALDGIARADLLVPGTGSPVLPEVSRRDLVKRLGVAAALVMLPAVLSSRPAEAAQSGGDPGPSCTPSGQPCAITDFGACCSSCCLLTTGNNYICC